MKTYTLNKNKFKVTLLMSGILSIASIITINDAFAQNEVLLNTRANSYSFSDNIINIGNPSGNLTPLKGFARDLPLIDVLKQITPNGWIIKKDDKDNQLNIKELISWKGGQSWVNVLDQASHQAHFKATVDWNKKIVTLKPDTIVSLRNTPQTSSPSRVQRDSGKRSPHDMYVAPTITKTVIEYELAPQPVIETESSSVTTFATTQGNNPGSAGQSAVFELGSAPAQSAQSEIKVQEKTEVSTVTTLTPVNTVTNTVTNVTEVNSIPTESVSKSNSSYDAQWTLDTSKSLKENVEEWGQKAGYKVVWNGDDYPVDNSRVLSGQFDSENGPIKQLALDYGPNSRVQQPLAFQFYQNNTLVIEDFRYEQEGYPQVMN